MSSPPAGDAPQPQQEAVDGPLQEHEAQQQQAQLDYEPLPQRKAACAGKRRRVRQGDGGSGEPSGQEAAEPPAGEPDGSGDAAACAQPQQAGTPVAQPAGAGLGSSEAQPAYRSGAVGCHKFEYLDHTADVQLHAWGCTLAEAFEQAGLALFNYMTPLEGLTVDEACTRRVSVSGHDLPSLLYAFLDELLFIYATEYIMLRELTVTQLDADAFSISATGRGEKYDRARHESGTEVKAITYSAMQIRQGQGDAEVFVIVDI